MSLEDIAESSELILMELQNIEGMPKHGQELLDDIIS